MFTGIRRLLGDLSGAIDRDPGPDTAADPAAAPASSRELFDALPVLVCVVDADHRYEFVNAKHARLHRVEPHEIEGTHLRDALGVDVYDAILPQVEGVLAGDTVRFESSFPNPRGGEPLTYETTYVPRREGSGRVTGFFSHSANVSRRKAAERERKALESQMLRAQKLEGLGTLAGGIAHDFNNLLGSMLGHADLVKGGLSRGQDVAEDLDQVRLAARRAAELCRQLLVYAGEGETESEVIELSGLVREMAELLEVSLATDVALDLDLGTQASVVGDATQLRQVLMNLLLNASEACESTAGGRVSLTTGVAETSADRLARSFVDDGLATGRYAFIEVADSGVGMDEEMRLKVFDPFFSTKFTGRGLGLAAVLGIVRGHGGAIEVESEPGLGTLFRVLIPASDEAPEQQASPERAQPLASPATGRVLVVDDEPSMRRVARRILESAGCEVEDAEGGQRALEIVERDPEISAVVLDLTMPEIDGVETLRRLRERRPQIPVVLCSGYSAQEVKERLGALDMPRLIEKPFSLDALVAAVQEALAEARP